MARQYLTPKAILDQAMSHIKDNSSEMRVLMLTWLNSLAIQVCNERPWNFLNKSAVIAITANTITLPDDFSTENSIEVGDVVLTTQNILNASDAFQVDNYGGTDLVGYTVDESGIVLHPGATGNATLSYAARPLTYVDNTSNTVFPTELLPLFERALLTAFYEYDVDADRMPVSFQLDDKLLKQAKMFDNQRKPIQRLNSHGYKRGAM